MTFTYTGSLFCLTTHITLHVTADSAALTAITVCCQLQFTHLSSMFCS